MVPVNDEAPPDGCPAGPLVRRSGGEGNRTPGLNSAIVALYQLSYTPVGRVGSVAEVPWFPTSADQAARNQSSPYACTPWYRFNCTSL